MTELAVVDMRWVRMTLRISAAVIATAIGYLVYSMVWGTPVWFNGLLDREAAITLLQQPFLRTQTGILDFSWLDLGGGSLGTYSLESRRAEFDQLHHFQAEIQGWNRSTLSPEEQLSYDILLWSYASKLAAENYGWLSAQNQLYAVDPVFGIQKVVPNVLMLDQNITDERSARFYFERLKAIGPLLGAVRADAMRQAALGVVPPDFIVEESIAEMTQYVQPSPANNPLIKNLADKVGKINLIASTRAKLLAEANAVVSNIVYPAYLELIAQEKNVLPHTGHEAGVWRLRNGSAYYASQLRYLTSTNLTPDEIHNYGLVEVGHISGQMDTILRSNGFTTGSVGARMAELMADPRFSYKNTEAGRRSVLNRYKQILDKVKPILPAYFSGVPAIPLNVIRMPASGEDDLAGGSYNPPSHDGKRPGVFLVNLGDIGKTPMWAMPTLAYHEGIPGHHLQTSIALENHELPLLRRMQFFPAYEEGWALYAEYLAGEMGLYKDDPYGDLGRLQAELLRAARLVVDTGIHAKHWSREQAIQYLQATTGMALSEVTMEVDRYVVWPGQACSYLIGMQVILGLRDRAISELGAQFSLREFHAEILGDGAMPLWLLQKKVEAWIAKKKNSHPSEGPGNLTSFGVH